MMFHVGNQDFISGFQEITAPGICHQIDRFGGSLGKNDTSRGTGMNKPADFFPGLLIGISRLFTQDMNPPVDIRIIVPIIIDQLINDYLWFLRGGGVIKINQRLTGMDFPAQDGKILTDFFHIQRTEFPL